MAYKLPEMYEMSSLPNRDGFLFIAMKKDGFLVRLSVKRCPITGLHHVSGTTKYSDLIGWYYTHNGGKK